MHTVAIGVREDKRTLKKLANKRAIKRKPIKALPLLKPNILYPSLWKSPKTSESLWILTHVFLCFYLKRNRNVLLKVTFLESKPDFCESVTKPTEGLIIRVHRLPISRIEPGSENLISEPCGFRSETFPINKTVVATWKMIQCLMKNNLNFNSFLIVTFT